MEIKSFILDSIDNLDKLSCHSHDPDVLLLINKIKKKGIELNTIKDRIISGPMGFHLHTYDYVPENFPNRAKLLQVSNIDEFGEICVSNRDKYISNDKHNELTNSIVKKGDLILAKTGTTIGKIALFSDNYKANLNQALGIIRLKKEYGDIKISPKYIHTFLNSFYGLEQFIHLGGYRAGQGGLSLKEISSIFIVLPDESKQEEIIKDVDKIRKQAIVHYNNYVKFSEYSKKLPSELLNIDIPNEENRVYISEKRTGNRIDAIFNSPFLALLKQNILNKPHKKLSDLMDDASNKFIYNNFYKLIDLDDIDERLSKIRSFKEVPSLNSTKTMFKEGNLLISKLGSEKGNVIVIEKEFDGCVGSGELVSFKLKNDSPVSIDYILFLIRSVLVSKQIEYSLSGSSRMRISKTGMQNLLIPIPKNDIEEKEFVKSINKYIGKAEREYQNYLEKKKNMFNVIKKHIGGIID